MVAVCFALNSQFATSTRAYYPLPGGWIAFSFFAVVDEPDLSPSQESAEARKIMNHESTPLRMRAFRVFDRQDGNYSRWIVLEDLERTQFRVVNYVAFGDRPTKWMKANMDRNDTWNVLNSLRNASRLPANVRIHQPAADSIDAAISQDAIRWQDLSDQSAPRKAPSSAHSEHEPTGTGKRSKPMAIPKQGGSPSEEQLQQMIDEVWDFAGGKQLEWKPVGRTPAGRKCEVLTFSGSDKVLVGPTSIEIPSQSS